MNICWQKGNRTSTYAFQNKTNIISDKKFDMLAKKRGLDNNQYFSKYGDPV